MPISSTDYAARIMEEITEDYEGDTPLCVFYEVAHEIAPDFISVLRAALSSLKWAKMVISDIPEISTFNQNIKDIEDLIIRTVGE